MKAEQTVDLMVDHSADLKVHEVAAQMVALMAGMLAVPKAVYLGT